MNSVRVGASLTLGELDLLRDRMLGRTIPEKFAERLPEILELLIRTEEALPEKIQKGDFILREGEVYAVHGVVTVRNGYPTIVVCETVDGRVRKFDYNPDVQVTAIRNQYVNSTRKESEE